MSVLVRLAALALVVYAVRTVDFRALVRRIGGAFATAGTPAPSAAPRTDGVAAPAPVGPCVNLNTADRADLERIVHVGGDRSRQIIEQRLIKPFSSLDELTRVTGVGPGTIEDIRRQGLACVR